MSMDVYDSDSEKKQEQPARHHRPPQEYSQMLAVAKPAKHHWSSYMPMPSGLAFDSQDKGEKILLFLRQHPIVNVQWITIAVIMFLAPFVVWPLVPFLREIPGKYQFMVLLAWYLVTAAYVIEHTLSWLFNAFIVTDERIIDLDFYSIISKEANYAQLSKIQDISTQSGGLVYSILDVGTVSVQTAAEVREFQFDNVGHPSQVVKLLNELIQEEEREALEGRVR